MTEPTPGDLSSAPLAKSYATVLGKRMAYHEAGPPGAADCVVFLHGNPTSSYLWRNVIPHVSPTARCLAPDLIGHGDSDKLDDSGPGAYTFVEHRRYLDALLDQLDLGDRVTLVLHDWGSALGFDWANRHRDRVAGIAYLEAIVRPSPGWDEWPTDFQELFGRLRSPAGEQLVLQENLFVETILPMGVLRELRPEEHEEYRRPFREPGEGRRPTLTWPRQIPIGGDPADVTEIARDYADWLATSDVPKLFVNAEPGAALIGDRRQFCRSWLNQTEVTVPGVHFIQEDSPHQIGAATAAWMAAR